MHPDDMHSYRYRYKFNYAYGATTRRRGFGRSNFFSRELSFVSIDTIPPGLKVS